ncbi:MAG: QueT transporter family protein [Ruminococcaceae bacterium]|nr:QueT transporter family protein [Oscillospiraceae bacterium]
MNSKAKKRVTFICHASLIAALYTVLTMISSIIGLSSGIIQFRISEALTVLPLFTPAAIPGLTVGCVVSNLLSLCSPLDVVFGSLATLSGAILAYLIGVGARKTNSTVLKVLVPLPNIVTNTLIIPWVLKLVYSYNDSIWYFTLTVGIGELISGGVLGIILLFDLENKIFKF